MTRSRRLLALACALCLASGALAAPALGAGNTVLNDCNLHGQLTRSYTVKQLRHALSVMPATMKQYTDCFDVVQQGLLAARHGNGRSPANVAKKSSGSSGSFLPTPVIIILVVLILAAVTFGALAVRRRRAGEIGAEDEADGTGTGETRTMPTAPPAEGSDEAPTRIDEPRDDDERP